MIYICIDSVQIFNVFISSTVDDFGRLGPFNSLLYYDQYTLLLPRVNIDKAVDTQRLVIYSVVYVKPSKVPGSCLPVYKLPYQTLLLARNALVALLGGYPEEEIMQFYEQTIE